MSRRLRLDENAPWKQRYRAPTIAWTQLARATPVCGLAASNRSGQWQLHAWDVPTGDQDAPVPEHAARCVKILQRVIDEQPALFEPPLRKDSCSWVSARLTELLPLPLSAKQELLELADARARLERINALLGS